MKGPPDNLAALLRSHEDRLRKLEAVRRARLGCWVIENDGCELRARHTCDGEIVILGNRAHYDDAHHDPEV